MDSISQASAASLRPPTPLPVAPARHTAMLIAVFLAITLAGAFFQKAGPSQPASHPSVVPLYVSLLVLEWGLVYGVWRGVRRSGTSLRDLIGDRWTGWWKVVRDVFLALVLWLVALGIQAAWERGFGPGHAKPITSFLPLGAAEIPLWFALSCSAGFCEELVFRGYFQRQFHAWTGSALLAVVLQSLLFGVSHGYQGIAATMKIGLLGAAYGALAWWRKSLRPGMIGHAWSDIFSGYLSRL